MSRNNSPDGTEGWIQH